MYIQKSASGREEDDAEQVHGLARRASEAPVYYIIIIYRYIMFFFK